MKSFSGKSILIACFLLILSSELQSREISREKPSNFWTDLKENVYVIPYTISIQIEKNSSMTLENISASIVDGLKDMETFTCLKFDERQFEEDYIEILVGEFDEIDCGISHVGKIGKKQSILLDFDCVVKKQTTFSSVIQEYMFYTLGFQHEYSRPDFIDFIGHNDYNVLSEYFNTNSLISKFDINSITQNANMLDLNLKNYLTNSPSRLSNLDIQLINEAYKCPDKLQGNGCYHSSLPTVLGNGRLDSNRSVYEQMEVVRVICDPGYHSSPNGYSYCENGKFSPSTFTCVPTTCVDTLDDCTNWEPFCETHGPISCPLTCGLCPSCFKKPVVQGGASVNYLDHLAENRSYYLTCVAGQKPASPTVSTCVNGTLTNPLFQCAKEIRHLCNVSPDKQPLTTNISNEVRTEIEKSCSNNFCLLSKLNYTNGQIFPENEILEAGDIAQLICDDGFESRSIPHIKCDFNVYTMKYELNHAKLECVKSVCEDINTTCIDLASKGFCDRSERIGFMRRNCKKSCGFCGSCKSPPYFDRSVSKITPMKNEFAKDDEVHVECFNGYQPTNITSSICIDGNFFPNQLLCKPAASSCTVDSLPKVNRGFPEPLLYSYPDGFAVEARCQIATRRGDVWRSTCRNGTFDIKELTCIEEKCIDLNPCHHLIKSCSRTSVQRDSFVSCGICNTTECYRSYFDNYLEVNHRTIISPDQQTYSNGQQVQLVNEKEHLTAVCLNGRFDIQDELCKDYIDAFPIPQYQASFSQLFDDFYENN